MRKPKAKKVPKRIQKVVDRCLRGETLIKTLRRGEQEKSEAAYTWHPSGEEAPAVTCSRAIRDGYLVPCNDGLFGAETSQTWRAA